MPKVTREWSIVGPPHPWPPHHFFSTPTIFSLSGLDTTVTVGSFGVVATPDDDILTIASTLVHPAYNDKTLANGFALILLGGTSDLATVELNANPAVPAAGVDLTVMGQGNILPGNLRTPSFLTSTVVQTSECTAFHSTAGFPAISATNSQFCAGSITAGFCDEDWGGPLVIPASNSTAAADRQVGVISW
jgi:secreted trypsin-like serine protease